MKGLTKDLFNSNQYDGGRHTSIVRVSVIIFKNLFIFQNEIKIKYKNFNKDYRVIKKVVYTRKCIVLSQCKRRFWDVKTRKNKTSTKGKVHIYKSTCTLL